MTDTRYDIIIIGCGSAGLSVGVFMNKAGFRVLMVSKTDHDIGGDCLNDGCVPSKALIHVAKIVHHARLAADFGIAITGKPDIRKVMEYVHGRQDIIREHENAAALRAMGIDVALGEAAFDGPTQIVVAGKRYQGSRIVIATGSNPRRLIVPGVEQVVYYDNERIFHIDTVPDKLLVVGGGPIGIEVAQMMSRLGSQVTVVHSGATILEKDDPAVTAILMEQLRREGIGFILNAGLDHFPSATEAVIKTASGETETQLIDAIFVGIGRVLSLEKLQLDKANVAVKEGKIVANEYLQTTNPRVYVCGDVAGSLQFSHAAEQQARLLLNNFFSPLRKKLTNDYMSWVTFTDPQLATFGLSQKQLTDRTISFKKLETDFADDDKAIVDNARYGKLIVYISQGGPFHKEKILGGTMVAPQAGELIQELMLANTSKLSINALFNKIYPYPVATRINQKAISLHKQNALTVNTRKLLRLAYKLLGG